MARPNFVNAFVTYTFFGLTQGFTHHSGNMWDIHLLPSQSFENPTEALTEGVPRPCGKIRLLWGNPQRDAFVSTGVGASPKLSGWETPQG